MNLQTEHPAVVSHYNYYHGFQHLMCVWNCNASLLKTFCKDCPFLLYRQFWWRIEFPIEKHFMLLNMLHLQPHFLRIDIPRPGRTVSSLISQIKLMYHGMKVLLHAFFTLVLDWSASDMVTEPQVPTTYMTNRPERWYSCYGQERSVLPCHKQNTYSLVNSL